MRSALTEIRPAGIEEFRRRRPRIVRQSVLDAALEITPANAPDFPWVCAHGLGHLAERPLLVEQLQDPNPVPGAR
jgi:hypothetical protein